MVRKAVKKTVAFVRKAVIGKTAYIKVSEAIKKHAKKPKTVLIDKKTGERALSADWWLKARRLSAGKPAIARLFKKALLDAKKNGINSIKIVSYGRSLERTRSYVPGQKHAVKRTFKTKVLSFPIEIAIQELTPVVGRSAKLGNREQGRGKI